MPNLLSERAYLSRGLHRFQPGRSVLALWCAESAALLAQWLRMHGKRQFDMYLLKQQLLQLAPASWISAVLKRFCCRHVSVPDLRVWSDWVGQDVHDGGANLALHPLPLPGHGRWGEVRELFHHSLVLLYMTRELRGCKDGIPS